MRKKIVLPAATTDTIPTTDVKAEQMVVVMRDGKITGAVVRGINQAISNGWYHYTNDQYVGSPDTKQTICHRLIAQGYELFIDE